MTIRFILPACLLPLLVPAATVTVPFQEDFSSGFGPFTPAANASVVWTPDPAAENLRVQITAGNVSGACTVQAPELGGPAATAQDFQVTARLRVTANSGLDNTLGMGFLGSDGAFTGSSPATSYYLADLRPGRNTLRLVRVTGANANLIADTTLTAFTLTTGVDYTLTVKAWYNSGSLVLEFSIDNGAAQQTFAASDNSPLTGSWFGLRPRTNGTGSTLDARYDYFQLGRLTSLSFTTQPDAFVRVGDAYAYVPAATNTAGQAATISVPQKPGWLSFTGGQLTGAPGPSDQGVHPIQVRATDAGGAFLEQTFALRVIPDALREPLIAEFVADNNNSLSDERGESPDWIEIFNPLPVATNLTGWALSDSSTQPMRWLFPPETALPAHGTLLVFASGLNLTAGPGPLHTNFKLSASAGKSLWLRRPNGSIASSFVNYPAQRQDIAYGRYGDYSQTGYLLEPTPGAANPEQGYLGFVADTTFTVKRGFYTSPQTVRVDCATPGADLIYTLDGSTPSLTNGIVVPSGGATNTPNFSLAVSATTALRVSAFLPGYAPSGPDTQTYFFLDDVIAQSLNGAPPAGWPAGPVNGQVLDYGLDPDVLNATTPATIKAALTNLPTISIVTDRANLFDPAIGIYVNGYGREDGWERPCSVEMLHPGGGEAFHLNAGIRIRGGASRVASNPKHGFHLYFRAKYGATKLRFPLFGAGGADEFDRIDLRTTQGTSWHHTNSGNAVYTRDEWSRTTQGDMGRPHKRSRYAHLYLNGQYWGIFNLDERADNAYASTYFGGRKEDYDMVKSFVLPHRVEAADGDALAWNQLHAYAVGGFTNDAPYFAIQGLDASGNPASGQVPLVDLDNLIDYMLLCFYTGNTDGPVNPSANVPKNFFSIRHRGGDFGFRFFAHDFEDTFNGSDVTGYNATGSTLAYFNPRWLHLRLADNARYRLRFADRAHKHLYNDGALNTPAALARWRAIRAQLQGAMLAESARWGDAKAAVPYTTNHWNSAHNTVENSTIPNRRATLLSLLRSRSLLPSIDGPAFSPAPGLAAPGASVTLAAAAGAAIHYRLDGGDPLLGGATVYADAIALTNGLNRITARARTAGGEWSALADGAFLADGVPAAAGNFAATEIHYHPAAPSAAEIAMGYEDDADFEFLELTNLGTRWIDLTGVIVTNAVYFPFNALPPERRSLAPRARLLVVSRPAAFSHRYPAVPSLRIAGAYNGNLSNSGETLTLLDRNGALIQSITYADRFSWPEAADGAGHSLVYNLSTGVLNGDDPSLWRPSAQIGGAPGLPDAAPFPVNPLGDTNGNGIPDLLEHALQPTQAIRLALVRHTPAGGTEEDYLQVSAERNLAADGFRLIAERSGDLSIWDDDAFDRVSITPRPDGTALEVWRSRLPAATGGRYVRLRVQP